MKRFSRAVIKGLVVIILFHVIIHLSNNIIAWGLERQLLKCPLPPDSQLLESVSIAGKMEGNGNGMQWFGIILIASDMDEAALSEWYSTHISLRDGDTVSVFRQDAPGIFGYGPPRFNNYAPECDCYQVRIFRASAVGAESTLWEALLNDDLRGH